MSPNAINTTLPQPGAVRSDWELAPDRSGGPGRSGLERAAGSDQRPSAPIDATFAKFAVDRGRVTVTIVSADTGEVVRQIPFYRLADLGALRQPGAGALLNSAA